MDNELNLFTQKHFPTITLQTPVVEPQRLSLNTPLILCPEMLPLPRTVNLTPRKIDQVLAKMYSDCGVVNGKPLPIDKKDSYLAKTLNFMANLEHETEKQLIELKTLLVFRTQQLDCFSVCAKAMHTSATQQVFTKTKLLIEYLEEYFFQPDKFLMFTNVYDLSRVQNLIDAFMTDTPVGFESPADIDKYMSSDVAKAKMKSVGSKRRVETYWEERPNEVNKFNLFARIDLNYLPDVTENDQPDQGRRGQNDKNNKNKRPRLNN